MSAAAGVEILDRAEALARARALLPDLRARADRCAEQRMVPPETIRAFKETGLLRLMQPKRYGGSELGWDVFCEVTEILATGCGSQGWVYRVLADHAKMIGTYPAEAQQEVWGADIDTQASSSFGPVGRAKPAPGGFELSGRFTFSSGIDHAEWVICGGTAEGKAYYFLVPMRDVTIIDDWFVSGLEGSGSKSFSIEGAFVPTHRALDWQLAALGQGPGTAVNKAPIFRLPRGGGTTIAFSALLVGMAQGMFDDWLAMTARRRSEGQQVAQLESIQAVAGMVSAEIVAARTLYLTFIRETMGLLEAGMPLAPERGVLARCQAAHSCQLALSAANRMRDAMGSSAVYRNPMERQFRNILAGAQHLAVNWPRATAAMGAQLLRDRGAPLGGAASADSG